MKKQKITILFDAEPLAKENKTGVGRTTEGLILALAHAYPDRLELVGHYYNFLGRSSVTGLPTAPNIRYRPTTLIPGKVLNMLRRLRFWIPFEWLVKERGDFHLFPAFIGWPSLFKTPSAPFIHDITYLDHPQYVNGPIKFDLRTLMPGTIKRSSFIITNSEASKAGLSRAYTLEETPVLVAHIPPVGLVKITEDTAKKAVAKLTISQPFILFFGTIEPRKNVIGLLEAYQQLPERIRNTHSLVLAGGKGWHDADIITSIDRLTTSGASVIQTGYVSESERAALFSQASLYVMPSHYEGFGMQLLEAMSYQTPMIVSDIPALREVAADAAYYCATDSDSIAVAIVKLLDDRQLRDKLVEAGNRRLPVFNWPTVADDIFRAITKALA